MTLPGDLTRGSRKLLARSVGKSPVCLWAESWLPSLRSLGQKHTTRGHKGPLTGNRDQVQIQKELLLGEPLCTTLLMAPSPAGCRDHWKGLVHMAVHRDEIMEETDLLQECPGKRKACRISEQNMYYVPTQGSYLPDNGSAGDRLLETDTSLSWERRQ